MVPVENPNRFSVSERARSEDQVSESELQPALGDKPSGEERENPL